MFNVKGLIIFKDYTGYYIVKDEPTRLKLVSERSPYKQRIMMRYADIYLFNYSDNLFHASTGVVVVDNIAEAFLILASGNYTTMPLVLLSDQVESWRLNNYLNIYYVNRSRIGEFSGTNITFSLEKGAYLLYIKNYNTKLITINNDIISKEYYEANRISVRPNSSVFIPIIINSPSTVILREISNATFSVTIIRISLDDLERNQITANTILSTRRLGHTHYLIKVNSTDSFMLVFRESYDPGWEAIIRTENGIEYNVNSIPVYGCLNGFVINNTGEIIIEIIYKASYIKILSALVFAYSIPLFVLACTKFKVWLRSMYKLRAIVRELR